MMKQKTDTIQGLPWPRLVKGTLIKRYKRFIADIRLADNRVVSAHCPNSGSMKACSEPGRPVYLSRHDNPRRKLKYTWELIRMPHSLVGVNTNVPNRLVGHSIGTKRVKELLGYQHIQPEATVGNRSRLDFCLTAPKKKTCYVEVKNCTLVNDGQASFPDAVTARGLKHLKELQRLVKEGHRCVMFFLIQRMDATVFKPADSIDPDYGKELRRAIQNGVEMLVYDVDINLKQIALNRPIPFEL